jgi:hypothetical protein
MTRPDAADLLAATRERLLGAWRLVGWEIVEGDRRSAPFGDDADGLIVYTADGWMNASIARAGRPPLSSASVRQAPLAEQGAAYASYFNYAGPFELRWHAGAPHVLHRVRFSLNPGFVGSEQLRRVAFDGERHLTLSADEPLDAGRVRAHRLRWRRATLTQD